MSESYTPQTVRFDRLPSQGVVYGFDWSALSAIVVAITITGTALLGESLLAAFATLPVTGPLAALGLVKRHGQPLMTHVLREIGGVMRKTLGATTYKARSEQRKQSSVSALDLPGREGRIHLYEAANGAVVVLDATKQTATISCMIATPGLGLPQGEAPSTLTNEERDALIFEWAKVLGSFTQKEHIVRVTVLEQTRPGTVAAERVYFEERALAEVPGVPDSYREALRLAEQAVVSHVTQLGITFKVTGEAKTLVKGAGGGISGLLALAGLEMATAEDAMWQAGFTEVAWLTPREWGAWGRSIIDPASQQAVDVRIGGQWEGVDPQAAVPMLVDEHRTRVETDSAWHRTYWIQEWPRYDTYPGFLSRLVFARQQSGRPVRHTFALVASPVSVGSAMKELDEHKRTWITNANLRARAGKPQSAADDADWAALVQHEADLVAGQGELKFTAYLTVTATSEDDLEVEAASMLNACAATGLEPRSMPWQQAEALMNVAYPCGLGMK